MSRENKPILANECKDVDVVDLLAFFWRARRSIGVGVLVGLVLALGLVVFKKPSLYFTSVPVFLIEDAVGGTSDQVKSSFESLVSHRDLIAALSSSSAQLQIIGGKAPFKLKNSAGLFSLEFASLSSDPTGRIAVAALETLADATRSINARINETEKALSADLQRKSSPEIRYSNLVKRMTLELADSRIRLFALESRLSEKAGVRPLPSIVDRGTAMGDDVLRLIAIAGPKLSAEERQSIITDYAQAVGDIRAITAKYERPLEQMNESIRGFATSIRQSAQLSDSLYPVFAMDHVKYQNLVATGAHERFERKWPLFMVLGGAFGAVMGLIFYMGRQFLKDNQLRLRRALGG
jgi:hypothetical protein